jgi:hypothetical protein
MLGAIKDRPAPIFAPPGPPHDGTKFSIGEAEFLPNIQGFLM